MPQQFSNNVFISQGNGSITTPSCDQQTGDTINVNWTHVISDMTLEQGQGDHPELDLGTNFMIIATTIAGLRGRPDGDQRARRQQRRQHDQSRWRRSAAPTAAPLTSRPPILDVYTGAGGGAYVQV